MPMYDTYYDELHWTDSGSDFGTSYLVHASSQYSKLTPPPSLDPACPLRPREGKYRFYAPAGPLCCGGLKRFLPGGGLFVLTVEATTSATGSSGLRSPGWAMSMPPKAPSPLSFDIVDSASAPLHDGQTTSALSIVGYPPCEANGGQLSWYEASLSFEEGEGLPSITQGFSIDPYMRADGTFRIPFNDRRFDWCYAQNSTMVVTLSAKNDYYKSTSTSKEYIVPFLDSNPRDPGVSATCVQGGDGQVAVSFSSSLFVSSRAGPDYYRIIVTEGQSELGKRCDIEDLVLQRPQTQQWTRGLAVASVEPPFRATGERWNPFKGKKSNKVTFVIGGSENACNSADASTASTTSTASTATSASTTSTASTASSDSPDASLYCNRPLTPGKVYSVHVQAALTVPRMVVTAPLVAVTVAGGNPSWGDNHDILKYVVYGAFPLAAINLILFVKYCRERRRNGRCGGQPKPSARRALPRGPERPDSALGSIKHNDRAWTGVPEPVTKRQFRLLYEDMLRDNKSPQLLRQFEALSALSSQVAASTPSRAGHLPMNASKNRYSNVIPFDKNRVRLLNFDEDDDVSNYINASFITGFSGWPEYIAAQGPKDSTTKDFWFMVWENNVRTVVMLTNLVEDGKTKCHQYYPELEDRFTWADLSVATCVQSDLEFYTLRTIVLTKGSEKRTVNHLHFREWPDFGCPASPKHVLQFCITLRRQALLFPGMIAVHCSAGVGRTGTLIALDILLQCIKTKRKIDVFGVVLNLREQRPFMVQSQEQYCFLIKCLMVAMDDPIIRKYKPACKGPKKAAELQALAVFVFRNSFKSFSRNGTV
ncbi:receptor-type tyrosine-protein phosphatase alpha-like [Thrips palmi]|uniref:protein-tyrosine-phosphatase n=1 Tax=Thrips palmi TaxID=161013 RepID=A0A6P8ZX35_THRPL|nr:receptor-type tyrosine-protein phosphatase alpha-like [Thrips palmi]